LVAAVGLFGSRSWLTYDFAPAAAIRVIADNAIKAIS
jgi:hypothetical protein